MTLVKFLSELQKNDYSVRQTHHADGSSDFLIRDEKSPHMVHSVSYGSELAEDSTALGEFLLDSLDAILASRPVI